MQKSMEHMAVIADNTDVFMQVSVGSFLCTDSSRMAPSSSSCRTRIDWNKLMLSESVEFAFSV